MIVQWTTFWLFFNHDDRFQLQLKWCATTLMILGAVTFSVSPEFAATPYPFLIFLASHIIFGSYGHIINDQPLKWINFALIPLDFWGMVVRI